MEKGKEYIVSTLDQLRKKFAPSNEDLVEEVTKRNAVEIIEMLEEFNLEQMKFQLRGNKDRHLVIAQSKRWCKGLTQLVSEGHLNGCFMNRIFKVKERILKVENYFYKQNNVSRFRIDPFHISFHGEAGVGKSYLMTCINKKLMEWNGWMPFQVYSRTRTDHWDGFSPETKILNYDDLAQFADQLSVDVAELILEKSNNAFIVPMADLEEKGMSFGAEFIVSSTNCPYPADLNQLRCKEAFLRRRDLLIEVTLKDNSIPNNDERNKDFANVNFYIKDQFRNRHTYKYGARSYTYEEIVKILKDESSEYLKNQRALLKKSQEDDAEIMAMPNNNGHEMTGTLLGSEIHYGDVLKRFLSRNHAMYNEVLGELHANNEATFLEKQEETAIFEIYDQQLLETKACSEGPFADAYRKLLRCSLATNTLHKIADMNIEIQDMIFGKKEMLKRTICTYNQHLRDFTLEYISKARETCNPAVQAMMRSFAKVNTSRKQAAYWLTLCVEKIKAMPMSNIMFYLTAVAVSAAMAYGAFALYKQFFNVAKKAIAHSGYDEASETFHMKREKEIKEYPGKATMKDFYEMERDAVSGMTRAEMKRFGAEHGWSQLASTLGNKAKHAQRHFEVDYRTWEIENRANFNRFRDSLYNAHAPEDKNTIFAHGHPQKVMGELNLACTGIRDFLGNKICSNVVLVDLNLENKAQKGFMIQGNLLMTTGHFWLQPDGSMRDINQEHNLYIQPMYDDGSYKFKIDLMKDLVILKEKDCTFVRLPVSIPGVKTVYKFFPDEREQLKYVTANIVTLRSNPKQKDDILFPYVDNLSNLLPIEESIGYYMKTREFHCTGFRYQSSLKAGDCGSIIVMNDLQGNPRITGMHVAGDTESRDRFSSRINRNDLDIAYDVFNIDFPKLKGSANTIAYYEETGGFKHLDNEKNIPHGVGDIIDKSAIVGVVPKEVHNFSNLTSKIIPSKISEFLDEEIKHKKEPAIISLFDSRNKQGIEPSLKAVNKYLCSPTDAHIDDIKLAADHLYYKQAPMDGDIPRRILTKEEALRGIDKTNIGAIDRNTSPGEPWTSMYKGLGKHNIITEYPFKWKDQRVSVAVDQRIENYKNNCSVPTLTITFPKDELRGKAKVDAVDTRTIECLPMDLTLVTRMYFGAWISMLYKNNEKLSCQGGLDPTSNQWGRTLQRLKTKGYKFIAGDYKNFDGKPSVDMIMAVCDMVNRWYNDGEVNATIRRRIVFDSIDRITACQSVYLKLDHGIPSGFALTMSFNSMLNDMYKCMAWLNVMPDNLRSLKIMEEDTDAITLGDDHVISLSDKVAEHFNVQTFGDYLASIGVIYTDANKNPYLTAPKYVNELEISFLKRTWRPHPQDYTLMMAPLDQDTIRERVHWIKNSSNHTQIKDRTFDNISESLKDMVPHGETAFADFRRSCLNAWIKAGYPSYDFPSVSYLSELVDIAHRLRSGKCETQTIL
jgi:hypothetical protein